jgi:large subunit ribosomal protein L18
MNKQNQKEVKRIRRHIRVRAKINGTSKRPRLSVFRSNKGIFLQIIDDSKGVTIVSVSAKEIKADKINIETGKKLGELVAKKAQEKKISEVVFDRGGYKYHGKIKAIADGARKGGLKF